MNMSEVIYKNVLKICLLFILVILLIFDNAEGNRVKRVIGGNSVTDGAFAIGISIKNSTSLQHICGGALVSPGFVLTAAHCFQDPGDAKDLQVWLDNAPRRDDVTGNITVPKANITSVYIHDEYDRYRVAHDIALIKLDARFPNESRPFDDLLPQSSFGLAGECNVYGYGVTEMNSEKYSKGLEVGRVKVISDGECQELLGKYVAPRKNSGMFCALGDTSDACQGDSGSPLVCDGILEGIVSYGMGCGIKNQPGVYTRVANHMAWIMKTILDNS